MKIGDSKFQELQKEWYQKLKEEGFDDIEVLGKRGLRLKNEHRRIFRSRGNRDRDMWQKVFIEAKTEYFLRLTQIVNDPETKFQREVDRIVLTLYCDGHNVSQIPSFLNALGFKRKSRSVLHIIRRYEHEWGLRTYTAKQMNLVESRISGRPATT